MGGRVRANTKFLYSRAKYASVLWFSVPVVSWVHRYTGRKTGVALGFLVHSSFLLLQRCRRTEFRAAGNHLARRWCGIFIGMWLAAAGVLPVRFLVASCSPRIATS